jgi:uncharacterized repeat protein (TIGR03899 family)
MSKEQGANFTLVDLKAIEKPLVKLIETVRDGVGAVYEPHRIVRKAKAEAQAAIIRAEGEVNVEEVAARARARNEWLENRRQVTIEAVSAMAAEFLSETVSEKPVDPDWTVRFFDYCQDVSDQQMQSFWAKLLSGEVTTPGTYSQRTLSIVRDMRPQDALAFTRFSTFLWRITETGGRTHWVPMLRTHEMESRHRIGLVFDDLLQLNALNLIHYDTQQNLRFGLANCIGLSYYGSTYSLSHDNRFIEMGECALTQAGAELAPIAGGKPDDQYEARVIQILQQQGLTITATRE